VKQTVPKKAVKKQVDTKAARNRGVVGKGREGRDKKKPRGWVVRQIRSAAGRKNLKGERGPVKEKPRNKKQEVKKKQCGGIVLQKIRGRVEENPQKSLERLEGKKPKREGPGITKRSTSLKGNTAKTFLKPANGRGQGKIREGNRKGEEEKRKYFGNVPMKGSHRPQGLEIE